MGTSVWLRHVAGTHWYSALRCIRSLPHLGPAGLCSPAPSVCQVLVGAALARAAGADWLLARLGHRVVLELGSIGLYTPVLSVCRVMPGSGLPGTAGTVLGLPVGQAFTATGFCGCIPSSCFCNSGVEGIGYPSAMGPDCGWVLRCVWGWLRLGPARSCYYSRQFAWYWLRLVTPCVGCCIYLVLSAAGSAKVVDSG